MSNSAAEEKSFQHPQFGLFCLIHGDRLGTLLGRFSISAPVPAAIAAASASFSAAIITAFEGTLFNPDITLDLAHDLGWWNQFFLAFATLVYIAGAYFGAFPKTLRELVDAGVIQATDEEWKKVRRYTKAKLSSTFTVTLPYVCGATASLASISVIQSSGAWFDIGLYNAGYVVPVHSFFLYYLLSYLTLRLYFAFLVLRMLFSFSVNIQPFHSDGCGGLGSLKSQSGNLYLGLLVFGLIAAFAVISNTVNFGVELFSVYNLFMLFSYALITSIAFFLPLYATSARMREAQEKFLKSISERYRLLQRKVNNDLVSRGSNEDILALHSLRATARAMQVWPFNYTALLKFAAVVSSPFIVIAVFTLV